MRRFHPLNRPSLGVLSFYPVVAHSPPWFSVCVANQVLFGDGTEVLLSKDCRLVTLVDKDGKRQTQPRRKAEHR